MPEQHSTEVKLRPGKIVVTPDGLVIRGVSFGRDFVALKFSRPGHKVRRVLTAGGHRLESESLTDDSA